MRDSPTQEPRALPSPASTPLLVQGDTQRHKGPSYLPLYGWVSQVPPTHSSVFVESRSQPWLHARVPWQLCSSQIVFFSGWQPVSTYIVWSLRRHSATLRELTGTSVPGLAPL